MKSRLSANPFSGLSTKALQAASPQQSKSIPGKSMMIADMPPTEIDESSSPLIRNFMWRDGKLSKRPGSTKLGSSLNGIILGGGIFYLRSGSTYSIALTKDKVYYYSSGTWTEIAASGGASLTGDDYHPFSMCVWPYTERFCFSQGVDTVKYLPSTVANYLTLSANCPAAWIVRVFNNRLNLFKTYETGDTKAQRHRYCINGDITDWTGVGSGYKDLNDNDDYIMNAARIGSTMLVYKERSITKIVATGYGATPFQYDQAWVRGRGLFASRSLASNGVIHFGLFQDGVFSYDGSQFKPIGFGKVDRAILDGANTNRLSMCVGYYLAPWQSYILGVPMGDESSAGTFYVYHEPSNTWTSFWYGAGVGSILEHPTVAATTIDGTSGTMDAQAYSFDSAFSQVHSGLYLLGLSDGAICKMDVNSVNDQSSAIPVEWQSKDYVAEGPRQMVSLSGIGIEYDDMGPATLLVEYSKNGGLSWTTGKNLTIGGSADGSAKIAWAWFTVSGTKLRYRVRNVNTGENVRIVAFHPIFMKGGDTY
jgi:hypothetical protein